MIFQPACWNKNKTLCLCFFSSVIVLIPSHQNKEFVCRGHDYERLEAFQQRMLGEFPQAIAMQHPNQPDEAILQCDAQCILQSVFVSVKSDEI